MHPPPPKPLPPKGAPPPPPGIPQLPPAFQPAAHALSSAMNTASATAATAARKSSSLLLPADSTQRRGPTTAAEMASSVHPERVNGRFRVPISPVQESTPTLDAAYAAQNAAIAAHDTTLAAASAGVTGGAAVTQGINEVVFVAGANAALREAELAAEATNRTLNSSLGLLKQIFD